MYKFFLRRGTLHRPLSRPLPQWEWVCGRANWWGQRAGYETSTGLLSSVPHNNPIKHPPQLSPITLNPQPTSINQREGSGLRPPGEGRGKGEGPLGKVKGRGGEWERRGRGGPSARRGGRARGLPLPQTHWRPNGGPYHPSAERKVGGRTKGDEGRGLALWGEDREGKGEEGELEAGRISTEGGD